MIEPGHPASLFWCNTHQRRATHVEVLPSGFPRPCCAPSLPGIMLPCLHVVDLTGILASDPTEPDPGPDAKQPSEPH